MNPPIVPPIRTISPLIRSIWSVLEGGGPDNSVMAVPSYLPVLCNTKLAPRSFKELAKIQKTAFKLGNSGILGSRLDHYIID